MSSPLVSIGLPVCDGAQHLRAALDSLVAQAYEPIEIIISDNASTDETANICRAYAQEHSCIHYERLDERVPVTENFRRVLEASQGEYFFWASDDDYWDPQFTASLLAELNEHEGMGIAMCAIERRLESGKLVDVIAFKGEDSPSLKSPFAMAKALTTRKKYNLYFCGLYRTSLVKAAMRSMKVLPAWDRWFIFHLALATPFGYVDEVLHKRLVHDDPFEVRMPEESFNVMLKNDPWRDTKMLGAIFGQTVSSTVVPWYRKMYTPVLLHAAYRNMMPHFWIPYARLVSRATPEFVKSPFRALRRRSQDTSDE